MRYQELFSQPAAASEVGPEPAAISDLTSLAPADALNSESVAPEALLGMTIPESRAEPGPRSPTTLHPPAVPNSAISGCLVVPDHLAASPPNAVDKAREPPASPVHEQPALPDPPLRSPPRYDSPEAIYGRCVAARSAWYATQPAGSIKTNQQYRRAVGLPLRYDKQSYEWCLDYKQMSKRCITSTGSREWTKEEMMAYLDWSKAEDERIEGQVAEEMGDNPLANTRRGVKDIWRRIEEDTEDQEALYSGRDRDGGCIVVKV